VFTATPFDDFDTCRGACGTEDTRQALIEVRRGGIRSFCITIDNDARDYLPHMYGAVNYAVIDEVRKLPLKSFMYLPLPDKLTDAIASLPARLSL
jgi:nitric oxide reductase activation protein